MAEARVMAIVRTGRAAHQIRDIGPAAGAVDGLAAIGRVSGVEALLVERAQAVGAGPVERIHGDPTPAIASAAPARQEEMTVTTPAPPAIPCDDCIHALVCKLRDLIPMVTGPIEVGPGLRVRYTEVVECDHYRVESEERRVLAARVAELAPAPSPTDRRLAQSPEDLEARRKKVAGNLTQESRQRGADANRARAAAIRATREGQAIGLLREHEGNAEAVGKIMGVSGTAVRGWIARMAAADTLPADVAALCAGRARKARTS